MCCAFHKKPGRTKKYSISGNQLSPTISVNSPSSVAVDVVGNIYVGRLTVPAIKKYTSKGTFIANLVTDEITGIEGMIIDQNQRLFVSSTDNAKIYVLDKNGNYISSFANTAGLHQLSLGPLNNYLYVADSGDKLIRVFKKP